MTVRELDSRPREQLAALYEIARAVNSTLELSEVLDRILGMVLDLFEAEAGSIMLLQDGKLRIRCSRGLPPEVVETTEVALGEGIAGWVARTGEMLLLNGKVEDSRFHGLVNRRDEITSSLCTPLRSRDGILGVMMVRRGGSSTFTRGQLEFFSSVGDQAAVAIENARLYRSERRRSQELALEQQKFQAIFGAMADGVVVTDPAGRVTHVNASAQRLLGPPDNLLGHRLSELLPHLPLDHIHERLHLEQGVYETDISVTQGEGPTALRVRVTFLGSGEGEPEGMVFLFHDVTERVRVERMKSEFLSAVSHELKTPLTTVSGFLELMLQREYERPRQEQYLRISLDEAQRLQRLIEDLLTLSRLESGRFHLHTRQARLDEIAARVLTGFSERHPSNNFSLSVTGAMALLDVDEDLMAQVLVNLLSNAVKYSPAGGRIDLKLHADEEQVRVVLQDEGIGIPRDKIPYIFDKFYRVDNSLTRSTGGTGLGLANARYIVESHGGSIWAESDDGRGSRFTFVLPRTRREPEHSEA